MFLPIYYLVLPFILAAVVLWLLKKYSVNAIPEDVKRLWEQRPIEKKWFRAVRRDDAGLTFLSDWEKQPEAVEAAYQGLKEARAAKRKASFQVLNDKGEVLEQVDS
jgi:hypothetical protein